MDPGARSTRADRWLVAAFAIVIAVPLIATPLRIDDPGPGVEKRALAPFPRIGGGAWRSMGALGSALSLWYDDHFGLRYTLARWSARARLSLLHASPSEQVAVGADGWLFFADDNAVKDYARLEPWPAGAAEDGRAAALRAQAWLGQRGIAYQLTVAPEKHVVCGERMPPGLRVVGDSSRAEQLLAALAGTGAAVDLRPALLAAKGSGRIYHKTDTHWNEPGALAAYQALVTAARLRVPAIPPAWIAADFRIERSAAPGHDLANMLGLRTILSEEEITLVPTRPRRARVVEPAGGDPALQEHRIVTEIDDPALPRAVVFRDSFASALIPFLSEHFSRVVYLWQYDFDAQTILEERPDLVIQEIAGRYLYAIPPSPGDLPR